MRKVFDATMQTLNEQKSSYHKRRDAMRQQVQALSVEHEGIKKSINAHDIARELDDTEKRLKHCERSIFELREFVDIKSREIDFENDSGNFFEKNNTPPRTSPSKFNLIESCMLKVNILIRAPFSSDKFMGISTIVSFFRGNLIVFSKASIPIFPSSTLKFNEVFFTFKVYEFGFLSFTLKEKETCLASIFPILNPS
jgi:hypothetical protein